MQAQEGSTTTTNSLLSEPISEENNSSSISCISCRKLHKRCDRLYPSCSKCKSRGITCSYNEPKKRGKAAEAYRSNKKKVKPNTTSSPSIVVGSSSSTTIVDSEIPHQIIYFYYTFISGGFPLIGKAKFEYFVMNFLDCFEKNSSDIKLTPNQFIDNMDDLQCIFLLYLSIKSTYYQINAELEKAEETMKLCEDYFGKLLPTMFLNFYLHGACQVVAIYYGGVGDLSKVKFYVYMSKYYLDESPKESLGIYERNLEKRMVFLNGVLTEMDAFPAFIENMPKIFEGQVDQKLETLLVPGTLEYLKTTPITRENYSFFKQVLDFVFQVVSAVRGESFKRMTDCHSESFFKFEQLHRNLIYLGFQMVCLNRISDFHSEVEEVALKISCLTEHEHFQYCIAEIVIGVKEAAILHLNICKLIESGKRANNSPFITSSGKTLVLDYYSILEKDYKALKCFEKKYQRVTTTCGSLLNEIETVLQAHYERKNETDTIHSEFLQINQPSANATITTTESNHSSSPADDGSKEPISNEDEKWISLLKYLGAIKDNVLPDRSENGDRINEDWLDIIL